MYVAPRYCAYIDIIYLFTSYSVFIIINAVRKNVDVIDPVTGESTKLPEVYVYVGKDIDENAIMAEAKRHLQWDKEFSFATDEIDALDDEEEEVLGDDKEGGALDDAEKEAHEEGGDDDGTDGAGGESPTTSGSTHPSSRSSTIASRLAATVSTTRFTLTAKNALRNSLQVQEIDNVGGGMCFWISIGISACSLGSPKTVQSLKQAAVAIIRNMSNDQVVTVLNSLSADGVANPDVDSYCVALEGESSFHGGDLEAMVLSRRVGPIHVYAPTAGGGTTIQHSFFTNENGDLMQASHPFNATVGDVAPTDELVRLLGGEVGPYPTNPVRLLLSGGHFTSLLPTDHNTRFEGSAFDGVRHLITTRLDPRIRGGRRQALENGDSRQGASTPTNPAPSVATKRPAKSPAKHPAKRSAKSPTAGDELNEEGQTDGNTENVQPNPWVLQTPNVSWLNHNGCTLKYRPRVPHRVGLQDRN